MTKLPSDAILHYKDMQNHTFLSNTLGFFANDWFSSINTLLTKVLSSTPILNLNAGLR